MVILYICQSTPFGQVSVPYNLFRTAGSYSFNIYEDRGKERITLERTLDSKEIYKGRVINLKVDTVELAGGNISTREIVEHPGAVCIIPVKKDGKIVFVSQYRKPVEKTLIELPAGKLEDGEDPETCAVRELEEETGYSAGKIEYLFSFYTSPGFSNEILHLFMATYLTPGEANPDEDEKVEVMELDIDKAVKMIAEGSIRDSKTIIGVLALLNRR